MNDDNCQHRCERAHKRVKYCAKCRMVHCLDCEMEWTQDSYIYIYPWAWTTTSTPLSGMSGTSGGVVDSMPSNACTHS